MDGDPAPRGPRSERAATGSARRPRSDPHRPRCHLTPPHGWLNDPNGLIELDGRVHLFYQHNPHAAAWGPPFWGHVVSADLVHWQDRPIALAPEASPPDDGGCWSGCAVDDDGTVTVIYTGVQGGEQTTCLAFGDADLDRWRKHAANPVQRAPADVGITQGSFRDPFVWRDGDDWAMVIGVSIADRGDALLYRSRDLRDWRLVGPLLDLADRDRWPDESHTWECVNLFPLGDRWVLLASLATDRALAWPVAFVGDFDGTRFRSSSRQRVDWGFHGFYAPLTMRDAGGRRLMWGWLQEQRHGDDQRAAGWSGAMSFPRELTLEEGRLRQRFAPELRALRETPVRIGELTWTGRQRLDGIDGHQLEVALELVRGTARRSGLIVRHAPEGATRIEVDWQAGQLELDCPGLSVDGALRWSRHAMPIERDRLDLHLIVDRSIVELLIDGRSLTARPYPARMGAGGIEFFADGGDASARAIEGWRLRACW